MAIDPMRFLVATRVVACMVGILPLYLIGLLGSYVASQASVVILFGQSPGQYDHYFSTFIQGRDVFYSVIKILIFALAIALIHCWYGMKVRGGPQSVGEATGAGIRASIVVDRGARHDPDPRSSGAATQASGSRGSRVGRRVGRRELRRQDYARRGVVVLVAFALLLGAILARRPRAERSQRSPATQAVAGRSFAGAHSLAPVPDTGLNVHCVPRPRRPRVAGRSSLAPRRSHQRATPS